MICTFSVSLHWASCGRSATGAWRGKKGEHDRLVSTWPSHWHDHLPRDADLIGVLAAKGANGANGVSGRSSQVFLGHLVR
jgi:hypothetical protein